MSESLRIALVAEGETDKAVVSAAIAALVGDRSFILRLLQPEDSLALEPAGPFTGVKSGGWCGVYRWCQDVVGRSGRLSDDPLFLAYDILIMHLDADVAGKSYADCSIDDPVNDLPCEQPCPPPAASTDRLRQLLLRWVGETQSPPRTVLCTPSKSIEAWVMAALFPQDAEMRRRGWECHPEPAGRLAQQPSAVRIRKSKADYLAKQSDITGAWPRLCGHMTEAARFSDDFRRAVAALP